MSTSTPASPFKSVLHTVSLQHEKALKQAFYNTAAIVFIIFSGGVAFSAYYVLEAFLRPLIWASLCGSFLFPFKRALTKIGRNWLKDLEVQNTPIIIGVSVLPFKGISNIADIIGTIVKANYKLLMSIFLLVPLCYVLVVFHPFYQIFVGVKFIVDVLVKILELFNYPLAVWTIFAGYVIIILFYQKSSFKSSFNNMVLQNISLFIWVMILFHLVSLAGAWRVPLSLLLLIVIGLGVLGEKKIRTNDEHEYDLKDSQSSVKYIIDDTLIYLGISVSETLISSVESSRTNSNAEVVETNPVNNDMTNYDTLKNPTIESLKPCSSATPTTKKGVSVGRNKTKCDQYGKRLRVGKSDPYFIALFWLFVMSRFWINSWLLELLPFLFAIYMLKLLYMQLGLNKIARDKLTIIVDYMRSFYLDREDIILPRPVKGLIFMIHAGDQKIAFWLNNSLDKLTSAFIILCLCIMAILGVAFFAVQVHHESSYLVTVVTDVVNKTVVSNQDYLRLLNLNDTDIRKTLDDAVHSAYMVGRKKISGFVISTFTNPQNENGALTEEQITQFLDQLYSSMTGNGSEVKKNKSQISFETKDSSTVGDSSKSFLGNQWRKISTVLYGSDMTNVIEILKENIHTLQSVLDSLWTILKGNLNLMFSITTHIFSVVLFGGTYLLNAVISLIIFITTLLYLLNASSDKYFLLELLSGVSLGTKFGESVNDAVRDVFGASLKMATFYGFYTWLTHSVFGANLVFIPAAFAAMLGVVPFIGTYWAAVPATLELWLIQQNGILALLFISLHMLPTYVVDTAIYSEIGGGGHPYLTGLAVAGGIYCFGLEGAFIGPIVLCCLIAAFNIYNGILNDDTEEGVDTDAAYGFRSSISKIRRAMSEDRHKR